MSGPVAAAVTRRRTLTGALVLGVTSGVVVGVAAEGYVAAYPDEADRMIVARSIGSSPGLAALFGEPRALETIAGFTEWRVLGILPLVGAVWALLAGTGALRGEEDAGRWDVLLAGPLSRRAATAWGVAGLGQTLLALGVVTTASTLALGARTLGVAGSLRTSAALLVLPAVVLGVAAVAAQVGSSRGQALRLGAAFLGVAYLLRVVAVGVPDLTALSWLTPLGWVDRAAPLTGTSAAPLLLAVPATLALAGLAVVLAGRRDAGAGLRADRGPGRSRTRTLVGPTTLAARLTRGAVIGWMVGMTVLGGVLGLVAPTASEALADSDVDEAFGDLGVGAGTGVPGFLGAAFFIVSLLLCLLAASHAGAAREEEASGRLETVLALPVGRVRWLVGRTVVATVVVLVVALTAGGAAWLATSLGNADQNVTDVLAGALNVVPAALVVLGLGTAVLGVAPRLTATVSYGYVAAAFLLDVVGSLLDAPELLLALSVFHHLALVPAADPEPVTSAALVGVAITAVTLGALALRRRDLTHD